LVIAKLLIHLLIIHQYELHRDEYLFAALGKHLDWGFFSVPPLIGFVSKLTFTLFGDTAFAYKLIPALTGAGIITLVLLFVRELGGKVFATYLAGLSVLLSLSFLRVGSLFQPVSFDIFFWTLSAYLVLKLTKTKDTRYWLLIGVSLGLAFLNKYMILFFIAGLMISILATSHRKLLYSRYFVIGVLLALIIISPNIWWQYKHHWVVMHHLDELRKTQLVNVSVKGFLMDQIMMNLNSIWIWIFGLVSLFFFSERRYRIFAFLFLSTLGLLLVSNGKSYYTLGLYPFAIAIGSYSVEKYLHYKKQVLTVFIALFAVLSPLALIPIGLPVLQPQHMMVYMNKIGKNTGTNRWEDGKEHAIPQDYADMLGWCELSNYAINGYLALKPEERKTCGLYAENYGQAGALQYYGKKRGIPDPICFNDAFLAWAPNTFNYKSLIYINDDTVGIKKYFTDIKLLGKLKNPLAREIGTGVFLCKEPRPEFYPFYQEKVRKLKQEF